MKPWYQDPAVLAAMAAAIAAIGYTILTAFIAWYIRTQAAAQRQLTNVQIFYSVVQRMEATRGDRAKLREYVQQQKQAGKPISMPLPPDVDSAADRVCREYDILGLLDRHGFVDRHLVDEFYSVPLALLHREILASYLAYIRSEDRRGPTHFWELAIFSERVRHVPENHPGVRHSSEWPAHPRQSPA